MLMRTFDIDDLFRRFERDLFGRDGRPARHERLLPPMEVRRTDSEMVVRVELPGVDPESVDVTLEDRYLRIRAERREPTAEQGEYLQRGFAYGTFQAEVLLAEGIDADKLSARHDNGILEVRVPYASRTVKITVEQGEQQKALKAAS